MCLAVPGKIVAWLDRDPLLAVARIEFEGIRRDCHMACVLDAEVGDYVLVHAGIAISRIDECEAMKSIAEFGRVRQAEQQQTSGADLAHHERTPK